MIRFFSKSIILQLLILSGLFLSFGSNESFAQKKRPKMTPIPTKDFVGRLLLIPLDVRFASTKLPRTFARIADFDVVYPPREVFQTENSSALMEWVKSQNVAQLNGVIIGFTAGQEAQRIEIVTWLRQQKNELPIYGFANKSTDVLSKIVFDDLMIDESQKDWAKLLVARFLNRTYQRPPKIVARFSGETTKTIKASLVKQADSAGVNFIASGKADIFLYVLTEGTDDAQFTNLIDALTRTVAAGYYVAVVDLSGNPDRLMVQLRERKLLDLLNAYAASTSPEKAFGNVLTQISARLISAKVLRLQMSVDQLQRAERAQIEMMLMRYFEDWGYTAMVKPKLEIYTQDPNITAEMAEEFLKNNLQIIANQLFDQQFRRNIHSVLLPSGKRAPFIVSLLQRLSVHLTAPPNTNEIEIEAGIHLIQMEVVEMPAITK